MCDSSGKEANRRFWAPFSASAWIETARRGGGAQLRERWLGQFSATYQLGGTSKTTTSDDGGFFSGGTALGGDTFAVEIDGRGESATIRLKNDNVATYVGGPIFRVSKAFLFDVDVAHSGTIVHVPQGDTDSDGDVDFKDFLTLAANFNGPGDWEDGSFNYDDDVGFNDFLSLSANFGATRDGELAAISEPSTGLLATFGALGLLGLRCRR